MLVVRSDFGCHASEMVLGGLERGGELTKLSAWPKLRTMACVALAYCAESIDNQLLSAMYLALSRSLGVHVQQLGVLNTARGLAQVGNLVLGWRWSLMPGLPADLP